MMSAIQEARPRLRMAAALLATTAIGTAGCDLASPPPPTPQRIVIVVTATPDGRPIPPLNPTATPTRAADGGFRATAPEKSPKQLYDALLATPFTPDELRSVSGLKIKGRSPDNLSPAAKALGAVGQVNAAFSEPGSMFGDLDRIFIAFVVYRNEADATASLNASPPSPSIATVPNPPGEPISIFESGALAITRHGNITILAFVMGATDNDQGTRMKKIADLAKAGVTHLQRIR